MKIIAGEWKGRRLVTPRGDTTRPTADQVRIALMDTLTPWLPGARVLDLFAGAGGVGLEALSRGAAQAVFVERDGRAVAALRQNVETLDAAGATRVLRGHVGREVARLAADAERFEVIFLDPPYDTDLAAAALEAVAAAGLLTPDGVVVAQHLTKRPPPAATGDLTAFRSRRFGETTLTFYRRAGSAP